MKNIRKILFISLSNLGDIVLTTPVLEKLREHFPKALVDVVTSPVGSAVFSANPGVVRIIVRERRQSMIERFAELSRVRKEKYDLVVDLKRSLLPALSGARYAVPSLLSRRPKGHMKDVHLGVLKDLGMEVEGYCRFFIPVSSEEKEFVSLEMSKRGAPSDGGDRIVVINPGAKSHIKRWSARRYAELIRSLEKEPGCRIFITGAEEDRASAAEIVGLAGSSAVDLSGRTSVGALYEIIRRSDLFITNDSGPLHLASAAGTPTVAVFGPSNEKKYGPLAPLSVVLAPSIKCRPCEKALCDRGFKDGCISEVTAEEVFEAAKTILAYPELKSD